ncbi:HK97 gp10 family phage protein [Salinispora sp. H7-4]|uniref:HK97 gp10 family phage protein n=1 Tax=Salinispora sp. H7-4 TaxID=2748321 RepID=UPI0015D1840D|nr:HK97 gp10 family phage protein [Salinispora sp. H7-4]NYT96327.1 HK97 gp10 family phage protein [Salinispora sp. H7-4]
MIDPIKIDGLASFTRSLRRLDADLPKTLRVGLNDAAAVVVDWARPRVPRRSGRAARSLRVASTGRAVRVRAGGARVPYYPWLDFGGRVGRGRTVRRPFRREGRYLWAGYAAKSDEVRRVTERALLDAAKSAGVEVD